MQTVLVLYGGRSAEHEISIISARFIVDSLDRERFEPLLVAIDGGGRWHLQREDQLPRSNDPREVRVDDGPLAVLAPMPEPDGVGRLRVEGQEHRFDIAFPILHGPLGEDGAMQGLLELAAVPYVGSGVTGCAVSMDKHIMKQILTEAGVDVLPHVAEWRDAWDRNPDAALDRCEALGYPLFVKPANMGSSLGIGKARHRRELSEAVAHAFAFDTKLVVERGLDAPREIEVAVLGNHEIQVSVPGEIVVDHADGFYSYQAKYIDAEGARLLIPAPLRPSERSAVARMAERSFRALDGAGMARVDMFMTSSGELFLNEINAIPGFTAISMYPQLWAASGLKASALVSRLLELGFDRHQQRRGLRTTR